MRSVRIAVLLLIIAGCNEGPTAGNPPATRPAARLVVPDGKVQFAQMQRTTKDLPGSGGAVRMTIGDITRGQTMLSLALAGGQELVAVRSVSDGDVVPFTLDERQYRLTVNRLRNALIGDDAASFTLEELPPAATTRPAMTEAQRVEHLIDAIANLEGATFIRNDVQHNAATAATLMRYRWDRDKDKLASAEEFVEKLATKSSTTGKPYVIRFKDGREVPSGEFLMKKLEELPKGGRQPQRPGGEPAGSAR